MAGTTLAVLAAAICTYAARDAVSSADPARELAAGEQRASRASARLLISDGFAAYDRLSEALANDDRHVREGAVVGLATLRDERSVPPLAKASADRDARVRLTAVTVLSEFHDHQVTTALMQRLKDSDPKVRASAASGLANADDPQAEDALASVLSDPDPQVRLSAASSLAEMGDARAIAVLIADLRSPIADMRSTSTSIQPTIGPDSSRTPYLLGRMGSTAIDPLIDVLRSGDRKMRVRAIQALGELRDPTAVQPLTRALILTRRRGVESTCGDPVLHAEIAKALARIGGKEAEGVLARALRNQDLAAVGGTCEFFIRKGIAGSEAALIKALEVDAAPGMSQLLLHSGNDRLVQAVRGAEPRYYIDLEQPFDPRPHEPGPYPRWGCGDTAH